MTPLPERIVGSTGPADHPGATHPGGKQEAGDREDDHAKEGATDVWNGIQGDLAAQRGGAVAADFGYQGVSGFMTRGGEKKDGIINEAEDQELWRDVWH